MKRKNTRIQQRSNTKKSKKKEEEEEIDIEEIDTEEEVEVEEVLTVDNEDTNILTINCTIATSKGEQMIGKLSEQFIKSKNPTIAEAQSKYMRNQFSFFGISTKPRREIQRPIFASFKLNEEEVLETVKKLWSYDEREYQFAGLDLLGKYKKIHNANFLPLYDYVIRNRSWWDTVDCLASNGVGWIVGKDPQLQATMERWIEDECLWIRRAAILHQLKYKGETNSDLLFKFCEKTMNEKDFFMRKAIGWALRQYSKYEKEKVAEFIKKNKQYLSPLSIKEGSKYI